MSYQTFLNMTANTNFGLDEDNKAEQDTGDPESQRARIGCDCKMI